MRARSPNATAPDGGRPLLYVVDDDEATLALLRDVAEEAGWEAEGFTRLGPLRKALTRRRPTLLILDDELPDGRGGDFARDVGREPTTSGVPMLVCTAARPMRRAEIGDWAPVIAKPFDLDHIERFLDSAAHAATGGERASRPSRRSAG